MLMVFRRRTSSAFDQGGANADDGETGYKPTDEKTPAKEEPDETFNPFGF